MADIQVVALASHQPHVQERRYGLSRILYVPHGDHFINRHFGLPEDGGIASDVWSSITLRQRNKLAVNSLPESHLAVQ